MLFDPSQAKQPPPESPATRFKKQRKLYERWMRFKQHILLRGQSKTEASSQKNNFHEYAR
jgi:hypothetical protein